MGMKRTEEKRREEEGREGKRSERGGEKGDLLAVGQTDSMGAREKEKRVDPERLQRRSLICMALLTLQYGAQPLLTQRFTGRDVIMTTVVLSCELVKIVCAVLVLIWQAMLNQTKLAFTALFMFLYLGYVQSKQQVAAILLLLLAATLLSLSQRSRKSNAVVYENSFLLGVIPILIASILSGFAATLCQWAAQVKKRSTYLMTIEMSTFGSLVLCASLIQSPDGETIKRRGFFFGWTPMTVLPVLTNALGGILVGLVTMYAGSVKKGFAFVCALLVTAVLQVFFDGVPPSLYILAALPLVVSSTIVHQRYPYVPKKKTE